MKLEEWSALFGRNISELLQKQVLLERDWYGHFRAMLGHYGILVIGDDDEFASVWLLDSEGRTEGPIWDEPPTSENVINAAKLTATSIGTLPDTPRFTIWPPGDAVLRPVDEQQDSQ